LLRRINLTIEQVIASGHDPRNDGNFSNMESQLPQSPIQFTEHGIPIRNLWYMLLYAWSEVPLNAMRGVTMQEVEIQRAPTLDALLASVLVRLMQQRLRIGLGHDYVEEEQALPRIRGRIRFTESLQQRTLDRSQVVCEFQGYSANSVKNQIIRTTLARLMKLGQFGMDSAAVKEIRPRQEQRDLRQKLRQLVRSLDGIDFIDLTPELIHRQLLARHDHDYRLMLAICDLIVQRTMPGDSDRKALVPVLDHELLVLYKIYERFVANFYRFHLKDWDVNAQKRLDWHARENNEHLPLMIPDLILQENSSGRMLILDTKFTAQSLVENQWGKPIYDSLHLYQVYAYLKSQEHLSEAHRAAVGILLYPAVEQTFSEKVRLQDHIIRIESVDLAVPWQEIERQLMGLIHNR
jgi:5-methylcytosine-specific restriction enzyme subunit McrC